MKNLQIIRRYFQVTKADRKISVFLVLSSIMANGPYLFVSLLFSMAIDSLSKGDANRVMLMMVIYFLLKICSKVFKIISLMVERRLYNDVYRKLQDQMVEKLDRIEMTTFAVCNKGELLNLVNGDVRVLAEFGTWLSEALLLLFSFAVSIVVLAKISLGLMAVGFLVNALVIWILNIYNEKYEKLTKEGKQKGDDETRFYGELLSGMREIKIFQMLAPLHTKYRRLNEAYIDVHNKQIRNRVISNILNPSITMCMEIVLMIYACWQCLHGVFGIDTVLIIQSYFGTMFTSLSDLVTALGELRIKHVSIDRYDGFMRKKEDEMTETEVVVESKDYDIQMNHLGFSYGEEPIFSDYSVRILPNTLTALSGPSGCGKSTFFHLLLRFEKPDSGTIRVGGNEIWCYPKETYAGLVTCVSQQPYLFHMSIYDNFALVNPDMDQIRKACRDAEIDDYIMSLPQGYETILKEGGSNLSGGQRQRIAIARALLKNAKVLLLDEITSALDEATAADVMRTVTKLAENHTILMISHKAVEQNLCGQVIRLGEQNNITNGSFSVIEMRGLLSCKTCLGEDIIKLWTGGTENEYK